MFVRAQYQQAEDKKVRCLLCPHKCLIAPGSHGRCLIRKNIGGELIQTAYGMVSAAAIDPIEKKPLYHFLPSTSVLSIGTNGCNMSCRFCQNWHISTKEAEKQETTKEELLSIAVKSGCKSIAYTYNEPLIWFEFVKDCAEFFQHAGLKNIIVSNGMINPEPLCDLIPFIDAANIDLKGFTDEFYNEQGGDLKTVKNTIKTLIYAGVHVEVTNLVIPGKNDMLNSFTEMCLFLSEINRNTPLHLSRYFPQYKYVFPPTPNDTLTSLCETAKQHLNYVYIGNADIKGSADTICPACGKLLIKRSGYNTTLYTDKNLCPQCSEPLPLFF